MPRAKRRTDVLTSQTGGGGTNRRQEEPTGCPPGSGRPCRHCRKSGAASAAWTRITGGGFPRGRPTLVCGGAGGGKTLFAVEFLVRGTEIGEPGVFIAFEETAEELAQNVASLGFDLGASSTQKKLSSITCTSSAPRSRRRASTTSRACSSAWATPSTPWAPSGWCSTRIESLFAGLSNTCLLRSELRRLFRWLKSRGVTAIVTAERGTGALTRHGLEEYVSDCVILLDQRVTG